MLLLLMFAHPATTFAQPLTNRGEPTTYCPATCGPDSLAKLKEYPRLVERCEADDAPACFTASTMRLGAPYCCSSGLDVDRVWALRTMKKACDLGHDRACWQFYVVLTPWMDNLAKDNAEKGCEAGLGYACHIQGSWPLMPDGGESLQMRACELGDPNGCALSHANLACGAETRDGVTAAEARKKLKYSCSTYIADRWEHMRANYPGTLVEHYGCRALADGLKMGWGGPTDWNRARWLDHYVCRESGSCSQLFPLRQAGMAVGVLSLVALIGGPLARTRKLGALLDKHAPPWVLKTGKWIRYLALTVVVTTLAYVAWGSTVWLS